MIGRTVEILLNIHFYVLWTLNRVFVCFTDNVPFHSFMNWAYVSFHFTKFIKSFSASLKFLIFHSFKNSADVSFLSSPEHWLDLIWYFKPPTPLNVLPHVSHLYFLIPSWTESMCFLRSPAWPKDFPHVWQWWILTPSWTVLE